MSRILLLIVKFFFYYGFFGSSGSFGTSIITLVQVNVELLLHVQLLPLEEKHVQEKVEPELQVHKSPPRTAAKLSLLRGSS
jgi:hypothetical protein